MMCLGAAMLPAASPIEVPATHETDTVGSYSRLPYVVTARRLEAAISAAEIAAGAGDLTGLAEGLAVDITSAGGPTPTVAFDPTELVSNRTFAAGADASFTWTFDLSGIDATFTVNNGSWAFSNTLSATTLVGAGGGITFTAPGGSGNLAGSVNTLQELVDAVDALSLGGGGSDDQTAAEVAVTPSGNLAANDVQEALGELQGDIDSLSSGTVADDSITAAKMANGDFGAFTIATNIATLDNGAVTDSAIADGAIDGGNAGEIADGSVTADDLGADSVSASELNATGVEDELEAVMDLPSMQGQIADAQIADGAVDGGTGGEIADATVTAADLAADSVSSSELDASGVESELEDVMDLENMQGAVTDGQVPAALTLDGSTINDARNTVTASGNLGATETFDFASVSWYTGTLDANVTLTLSNLAAGAKAILQLSQDATGSRTITWPAAVLDPEPTLNSTASSVTTIVLYSPNGTDIYASGGNPLDPNADGSIADAQVADAITVTGSVAAGTYTGSANNGNLATSIDTVQELNDAVDNLSLGGTSIDSLGDAAADGSVAQGANEMDFTSTIDASGESVWTITNTDADAANDNSLIDLRHNDGADANVFYMRMIGDNDGTPTNDFLFSQAGLTSTLPVFLPNTGLRIFDSNASHRLTISGSSDLTGDRSLVFATGDSDRTITLTNNFSMSGNFALTLTQTGTTDVTLPTTGTLATVGGALGAATATTATAADNDTSVSTTAFVQTELDATFSGSLGTPSTGTQSPTWSGPIRFFIVGGTATVNLPAASAYTGRAISFYFMGSYVITAEPNASEIIYRAGTAQTGGVNMTITGTIGQGSTLLSDGTSWVTLPTAATLAVGT